MIAKDPNDGSSSISNKRNISRVQTRWLLSRVPHTTEMSQYREIGEPSPVTTVGKVLIV